MIFENLDFSFLFFLFFLNDSGFFFFYLKMHEAWANAPSLEHKSMSFKKT